MVGFLSRFVDEGKLRRTRASVPPDYQNGKWRAAWFILWRCVPWLLERGRRREFAFRNPGGDIRDYLFVHVAGFFVFLRE
jgi:hypothetical protein